MVDPVYNPEKAGETHLAVTPDEQLALGRVDPVPGEGIDLEFLLQFQSIRDFDRIQTE